MQAFRVADKVPQETFIIYTLPSPELPILRSAKIGTFGQSLTHANEPSTLNVRVPVTIRLAAASRLMSPSMSAKECLNKQRVTMPLYHKVEVFTKDHNKRMAEMMVANVSLPN